VSSLWPVTTIIEAARATLLRGGAVTRGFRGLDVRVDDDHLVIHFLWRQNATRFAIRLPLPEDPPQSPWTGEPVDSGQQWVSDVAGLLMEELDTGFVRRARRIVREGHTELVYPAPGDLTPSPFYLSSVPVEMEPGLEPPAVAGTLLVEGTALDVKLRPAFGVWRRAAGVWLRAAGLDTAPARRAIRERRLIAWDQAVRNAEPFTVLGHAVVSETADRLVARLDHVELTARAPRTVVAALAEAAVHHAADAGATTVITTVTDPELATLGFRPAVDHTGWVVATAHLRPVTNS
jgi:hypothetical protein